MTAQQPTLNRTTLRLGKTSLSWGNLLFPTDNLVSYTLRVRLNEVEDQVLNAVASFRQLPTNLIKAIVYPGKSGEPQRRAVDKLIAHDLITLVPEPIAGPNGGGSMRVFQLGREGWKHKRSGPYRMATTYNRHQLAIASAHALLVQAQHDGLIKLYHHALEPDCHYSDGFVFLEPDEYVDIGIPSIKERKRVWIEIDRGTESRPEIMKKINDYAAAHANKETFPLKSYPTTLFLTTSPERAKQIRYWLQYAGDLPDIFTVGVIDDLIDIVQQPSPVIDE